MRGRLVVFEGPDAAGKQTQTELLAAALRDRGRRVKVYSFHRYATELGGLLKDFLTGDASVTSSREHANAYVLQALAACDKLEVLPEILATLDDGVDVLCDRWWPSAIVYGGASGLPVGWLARLSALFPIGNVNFLLDVPLAVARARKPKPDDHYEADSALQQEIRKRYTQLWTLRAFDGGFAWRIVDAARPAPVVHAEILSRVEAC